MSFPRGRESGSVFVIFGVSWHSERNARELWAGRIRVDVGNMDFEINYKNMSCLFCKIIKKEIPNFTVFENDYVLAFLDIHPCCKGHTVVIPKKHFTGLLEMSTDDWTKTMDGVRDAMQKVQTVLNPEGMNIAINERAAGGQVVPHAHWHIFPRWEGDGGGNAHSIIRTKEHIDVGELSKLF